MPKLRVVADKFATGPEAGVPMPVRLYTCGLFDALSVKVMLPVRVPVAVGLNVTLIVHVPAAATKDPQLLV